MHILYIHQTPLMPNLEEIFSLMGEAFSTTQIDPSIMKVTFNHEDYETPFDYHMLHGSIMSDFEVNTNLLSIDQTVLDYVSESLIIDVLPTYKNKAFDAASFLLTLANNPKIKRDLKQNLLSILSQEYIDTALTIADANMNFSIAAKKAYIHRNTLQYRIDKIYEKTHLDIKTFKGLAVFTMIFDW
ncbi:MAG: helix-turn-helix domain-containing protein [Bacillota bacterium]